MLILGICDDEAKNRRMLSEYVTRIQEQSPQIFQILTFSSAEEVLASSAVLDILLLDVQMKGMDGISAARRIREKGQDTVIILVTNYAQYAVEGYEIQAFHFLKKPVSRERLGRVLMKAADAAYRRRQAAITVKGYDQMIRIRTGLIEYCETARGCVLIHTAAKEEIRCYSSMARLEKEIGCEGFFRCHTAFLVNMGYIERLEPSQVMMRSGVLIPVSKHRRKEFREALAGCWGGDFL